MGPEKIPATNIDILGDNSLNVTNGQTGTLTATVLPIDHTEGDVVWTSSNTNVLTLSKIGSTSATFIALAAGNATISATVGRTNGHH